MAKSTKDQSVKVYGADWCPLTRSARLHLKELQVPFEVKEQNGGKILAEPSNQELDAALGI